MRNTFADIMRSRGVDVALEYERLHVLVYGEGDFCSVMEQCFEYMPFRGTAIALADFERECGLSYVYVNDLSLDSLLGFAEYIYNFARAIASSVSYGVIRFHEEAKSIIRHIETLAEKLDYKFSNDDGFFILVEANNDAWQAAEVAPREIATDLVNYTYRGLTGDIDAKQAKLAKMVKALEASRQQLKSLCKPLESDLFFLANNFNIRHNNVDAELPKQYNPNLKNLSSSELEAWYDELHRMCVAAVLLLHFSEKKCELDQFKSA